MGLSRWPICTFSRAKPHSSTCMVPLLEAHVLPIECTYLTNTWHLKNAHFLHTGNVENFLHPFSHEAALKNAFLL